MANNWLIRFPLDGVGTRQLPQGKAASDAEPTIQNTQQRKSTLEARALVGQLN